MATLGNIGGRRGLSLPKIPIDFGRDVGRLERTLDRSGREHREDMLQLSDPAIAYQFARQPKPLVAALLAARLQDTARLLCDFNEFLPFADREREGFFTINIFAAPHRMDVDERVPMIGSTVHDDINSRVGDRFAEVGKDCRAGMFSCRIGGVLAVNIANGDHAAKLCGAFGIAASLSATTDQQDTWLVVRRFGFLRHGQRRVFLIIPTRQAGSGREGGGRLERTATSDA